MQRLAIVNGVLVTLVVVSPSSLPLHPHTRSKVFEPESRMFFTQHTYTHTLSNTHTHTTQHTTHAHKHTHTADTNKSETWERDKHLDLARESDISFFLLFISYLDLACIAWEPSRAPGYLRTHTELSRVRLHPFSPAQSQIPSRTRGFPDFPPITCSWPRVWGARYARIQLSSHSYGIFPDSRPGLVVIFHDYCTGFHPITYKHLLG